MMSGREKSDSAILVMKPTNKIGHPVAEPEMRRHAVLKYFKHDLPGADRDGVRVIMLMPFVRVPVTVTVMMPATAQEPCTRDVDGQAKTGNRDRLAEVDRDRRKIRLTDS
jgi:hypothetical protein